MSNDLQHPNLKRFFTGLTEISSTTVTQNKYAQQLTVPSSLRFLGRLPAPQVDVLLFYTPEAMQEQLFASTAQMESYITEAMSGVQIGVDTSLIDLNINPVHIQMASSHFGLRIKTSRAMASTLTKLREA